MTLQSAGLPPARYRIDAVDINPSLLRKAEKGVYEPNSFRGGLPAHCERYFKVEGAARIVNPEARAGIRFIQGNIMGSLGLAAEQTYDIIFCRNLLIYQHANARGHIIAMLERLLKPAGLLFVGHAEIMSLLTNRYEPAGPGGSFAYCKIKARPCNAAPESAGARGDDANAAPECRGGLSNFPNTEPAPSSAIRTKLGGALNSMHAPSPSSKSRLERVRVLADQGHLEEAAAMCQDLLKENPQLAEAHFLLGVIRTAAGQVKAAEECLERALYLNADYYDALIHFSLLKARRGDEAGSERLRRHAERVRDLTKLTT